MAMTAVSVDSLVALGFVLGLRHAIEADHLAAISTIVTERRSLLSSLLVGASWGFGHTLALLVAGVGVLLLRYQMTDRLAHALELGVGMMLVLLGGNVLRTLVDRGASHGHAHPTVAADSHADAWLVARPLLVGMVHGLAGSAPLLLLTLTVLSSPVEAFSYIAVFGVGSMIGMAVLSTVIAVPLAASARWLTWANRGLQATVGAVTVAIGVTTIVETVFG